MSNIYNDACRVDFKAKVSAFVNGSRELVKYVLSLELNASSENDKKTIKSMQSDFMDVTISIYLLDHDNSANQENILEKVKAVRETAKSARSPIQQRAMSASAVKWHNLYKECGFASTKQASPSTAGSRNVADTAKGAAKVDAPKLPSTFEELVKDVNLVADHLALLIKVAGTIKPSHGLMLGLDRARKSLVDELNKSLSEAKGDAKPSVKVLKATNKATKAQAKLKDLADKAAQSVSF